MPRPDLRQPNQLRPFMIEKSFLTHNRHSVLISCGQTKVLCVATLEEEVPRFKKKSGEGWLTAEYSMLPCATNERIKRERNHVSGRTQEIQRLIGRALRSVVDLTKLGERTIRLDADVIQADGGTRTASITGCFIALRSLVLALLQDNTLKSDPVREYLGAISVGLKDGEALLDLSYLEDCSADVDLNVVMTASGAFVELQGTAEQAPFDRGQLNQLLDLAVSGIKEIITKQKVALEEV